MQLPTKFRTIILRAAPALPAGLQRRLEEARQGGGQAGSGAGRAGGKARVVMRVVDLDRESGGQCLVVDHRARQISLVEPAPARTDLPTGRAAPRMFAFDSVVASAGNTAAEGEDARASLAAATLSDLGIGFCWTAMYNSNSSVQYPRWWTVRTAVCSRSATPGLARRTPWWGATLGPRPSASSPPPSPGCTGPSRRGGSRPGPGKIIFYFIY